MNNQFTPALPKDLHILLGQHKLMYAGIAEPKSYPEDQKRYDNWVQLGKHGSMNYLQKHRSLKLQPNQLLPGCQSIILIGFNYYQEPSSPKENHGRVARYAWGRDYHKVLGKKLKKIIQDLQEKYPNESFSSNTDATPLLERKYALEAGLGYVGKNTMIISQKFGSYFLIGEILTTKKFTPSDKEAIKHGSCGTCTRCKDICPTGALDTPYNINGSKCISYLTIEHRGSIPEELRPKIGNWLFGCDLCQEVCPHNTRAKVTNEPDFVKRIAGESRELKEILEIETDEQFLEKFAGSPLMRAKREGLIRNACIVAGNMKCKDLTPQLQKLTQDKNQIIAEHAMWALKQIENTNAS